MSSADTTALASAAITRRARSSFTLSFLFLGRERRQALAAIYAFCRTVDDAVDDAPDAERARAALAAWRAELEHVLGDGEPETALGRELRAAVRAFAIPGAHLRAVVDGVAMDIDGASFADLPELEAYCAKVASAVGLACLPVFGVSEASAGVYADRLGRALQLTNIARDLHQDAVSGRCYVPDDLLAAAGVERAWLDGSGPAAASEDGGPVHRLVDALAAVAGARFAESLAALPHEPAQRRRLVPAEIMAATYARLLRLVVARRGRIAEPERLRVATPRKLALALRTWARGRRP